MNPWDELWDEQSLKNEVEGYLGTFDEERWCLDGGMKGDETSWAWQSSQSDFHRYTTSFVYQLAWNCAVNSEKDKYSAIKDAAIQNHTVKALDYGCGVGSGVIMLALEGITTLGTEINKHCLEFTKARIDRFKLYNKATLWDLYELPLTEDLEIGLFDMVVCTEVFEHLENPHEIAKKLVSILNPGGIAVFSWSFVPMVGHLPQHFHLQASHPDQLLTMGFGKFVQDELGMKFEKYTWFNNMLWRKE